MWRIHCQVEPLQTEEPVSAADVPFEFMMNALRLIEGFDTPLFAERTGCR
jgi:oxygen-independent coproporphyrinogen-3 oxidase